MSDKKSNFEIIHFKDTKNNNNKKKVKEVYKEHKTYIKN